MLITVPILAPAIAAAAYALFGRRATTAGIGILAVAAALTAAITLALPATDVSGIGPLRLDTIGSIVLVVVAATAVPVALLIPRYLHTEMAEQKIGPLTARGFGALTMGLIAVLHTAVLTVESILLLPALAVAVAAVTILSGRPRTVRSRKISHRYFGVATVALLVAAPGMLGPLTLSGPPDHTTVVDTIALVGAMAGLACLATVVPLPRRWAEAVAEVPAPIAALAAIGIPTVALFALARVRLWFGATSIDPYLDGAWYGLIAVSVTLAGIRLLSARDFRTLPVHLAIIHLGLASMEVTTGKSAAAAGHLLGAGLAAAAVFCCTHYLVTMTGSGRIATVRGLWRRAPLLGGYFAAATLLLLATPPMFTLFGLTRVEQGDPHPATPGWPIMVVLPGYVLALAAVPAVLGKMLSGTPDAVPDLTWGPPPRLGAAAIVMPAILTSIVVLAIAGPLASLWRSAPL